MSLARINGPTAAPTLVTNVLAACAMGGVSAVDRQVGALIAAALLAALGDHLLRHTRLAAAVTSFACALALLALAGGLVALAGCGWQRAVRSTSQPVSPSAAASRSCRSPSPP